MLCERLAEQFSFTHIHYEDFERLKTKMIESISTSAGYIIDQFPTSFDDLRQFQTEVHRLVFISFIDRMILSFQIGPCSVLIYIGEHQLESNDDELNDIVNKFKKLNKAIYVNLERVI